MADYTMQSSKGFNPFLMDSDYSQQPAEQMFIQPENPASNPFLAGFGAPTEVAPVSYAPPVSAPGGDNPFLSYSYPTSNDMTMQQAPAPVAVASHNPFADFGAPAQVPMSTGNAFFGGTAETAYQQYEPSLIDHTSSEDTGPHQSTKDLLQSVTGALEATSDSLLDRLRTNAPSPVPDLCPSPRSPSPDLMFGDETPPPPPPSANPLEPSPNQLDSMVDLFDGPAAPSGPKSTSDILGLYNTVTVTTAKPPALVQEVPSSYALVDLVIEPATPKIIDEPVQVVPSVPSPLKIESPVNKAPEPCIQPTVEPIQPTSEPIVQPPAVISEPPQPQRVTSPPQPAFPTVTSPVDSPHQVPHGPSRPIHPVHASPSRTPPERPKPPPVPAPPAARSPVHESKPLPSRPPPPVPPAPRISPQPPPVPAAPVHPVFTAPTQAFGPSEPVSVPHHPPPPVVPPQPVQQSAFPPTQAFAPPVVPPVHHQTFAPSDAFAPIEPAAQSAFGSTGGDIMFGTSTKPQTDPFSSASKPISTAKPTSNGSTAFDAFDEKFEKLAEGEVEKPSSAFNDPFGGAPTISTGGSGTGDAAWGGGGGFTASDTSMGFGAEDNFDSFLSLTEPPPVPQSTPARSQKDGEDDFDKDYEDKEMSIIIRPRNDNDFSLALAPALAPPPKSPAISTGSAYSEENNTSFVPFLSSARDTTYAESARKTQMNRTDSSETPQSPLYEEDTSQPLEDFPRTKYISEGWEMQIRLPNKKKITGNRFWKKVWVIIGHQNDIPIVQIYNNKGDKEPFQEIPLQPCYSCSDISAQQFDQYGKIFTMKVQYVFYKERPGVRPGQISKAGRLSNKLSAFAAYAMTGDYSGVKEFGSDLKKLGLPLEHAPQISQLVKLGSQSFEDMKQFSVCIEEALFTLPVHRDRVINYKTEEIQVTIVDEYVVVQDTFGVVLNQIARVRLFFLSFLNGVAEIEMGVNDLRRQGKEIVGRHDICAVPTEEWIRMESIEFSTCVQLEEFEKDQTIKFKPPDACYLELMRFRVRPPKHRELPLQIKTTFTTTGQRVEIRSDILVPGFTSRKLGQIPCEDVMVRFPIPETWIYMFRVEKHFRYGSVKSAHRRSGKVKGVERILGALDAVEPSLMETTSGQAKYEHQHKAIVWRIPRLPKEGQGAYTTHSFFCHITLQAHEKMPDNLSKYCFVEFTMPHTTVSHTVCRSISVPTCDDPPEKCCRYLARHEYSVEIEHKEGMAPGSYNIVAAPIKEEKPPTPPPEPEDKIAEFDSDFSDD